MKIARCRCGRKGIVRYGTISLKWYVRCSNRACWFGKLLKTERGAIAAWNRVMAPHEREREKRRNVKAAMGRILDKLEGKA